MIDKVKQWFFGVFLSNYVGGFVRKGLAWASGFLVGEEIATAQEAATWEELTYKIAIDLIPWVVAWALSVANKKVALPPATPKVL